MIPGSDGGCSSPLAHLGTWSRGNATLDGKSWLSSFSHGRKCLPMPKNQGSVMM
jgi:hypothetical protein